MKLLCILYITFSLKCEVFPSFICLLFLSQIVHFICMLISIIKKCKTKTIDRKHGRLHFFKDIFKSKNDCSICLLLFTNVIYIWNQLCCILDQQHNGQINGKHNKYLYGAVPFCGILCHHSLFCSEGKVMSIIHNAPEHCMYTYSNPQQFFHFWVIFFPNQKNPLC